MVVVREKLLSGGVYEGGAEVLSSVADGTISGEEELGNSDEVSGVSVGASDEDGTSEVESAALLEGSTLERRELEGAGVSLLDSGVLDGAGVSLLILELAGASLLDSGVLDGAGDSLLKLEGAGVSLLGGSIEELGGLPELLEGDAVTVTGSAVETSVVGSRVIVGLSTDVIVDRGGADTVETMVVGSS